MKKVVDVSIGHMSFTIDEDAYFKLRSYLDCFKATIKDSVEADEVMEDVESRVAEIFMEQLKFLGQVVDISLVDSVISHLGEIDSESKKEQTDGFYEKTNAPKSSKQLFRDSDRRKIAGVSSGLSYYFDVDVTIIRVLFVVFSIFYGFAFLLYMILWVAMPMATTVAQKLQMRGVPPTAENIRMYTYSQKTQNN